jgi:acetyltransferase
MIEPPARNPAQPLDESDGIESIVIGGGGTRIRLIRAAMSQAYRVFVDTPSLMSRLNRFHFVGHLIHDSVVRQLTDVDQSNHVASAAFDDAEPGRVIAEARYIVDELRKAEWASAMADQWQHKGVGHALASILLRHARTHRVIRRWGTLRRSNEPMRLLAPRLEFTERYCQRDSRLVLIERVL